VDLHEFHVLVLEPSFKLNREAPVEPPTREVCYRKLARSGNRMKMPVLKNHPQFAPLLALADPSTLSCSLTANTAAAYLRSSYPCRHIALSLTRPIESEFTANSCPPTLSPCVVSAPLLIHHPVTNPLSCFAFDFPDVNLSLTSRTLPSPARAAHHSASRADRASNPWRLAGRGAAAAAAAAAAGRGA
jgi:hypothetical protein